jgi:hypothetical protein
VRTIVNKEATGQDPQWTKEPAWAKHAGQNTIPATESHVGEGQPAAVPGAIEHPTGQTVPAPAPQ